MAELKSYAEETLPRKVPGLLLLARGGAPHILPISLPGYKGEPMVRFLGDRGICISSGSACHRGAPSHVFAALGLPKPVLDGALRVSFSPLSTREDVDALADGLLEIHKTMFQSLS